MTESGCSMSSRKDLLVMRTGKLYESRAPKGVLRAGHITNRELPNRGRAQSTKRRRGPCAALVSCATQCSFSGAMLKWERAGVVGVMKARQIIFKLAIT
jgi:hypothetical protein